MSISNESQALADGPDGSWQVEWSLRYHVFPPADSGIGSQPSLLLLEVTAIAASIFLTEAEHCLEMELISR